MKKNRSKWFILYKTTKCRAGMAECQQKVFWI